MTGAEVLAELAALGTEQNRKIYRRHGVAGPSFGVSYANLGKLTKKIKKDHALAQQLWASGNHDARILATMIADPKAADASTLDVWAGELDNYVETDALSGYVGKSPLAREKMEQWIATPSEWIGTMGWNLLSYLALQDRTQPDEFFAPYLATIVETIHTSKNRVRHAMNNAVIAIGMRNDALEPQAIAAARAIGKVVVDHGETGCKTPDAAAYIRKARDRQRSRQAAAAS